MNTFKNAQVDDTEEELVLDKAPKNRFSRVIPVRQESYYMYDEIGDPRNYIDLIHLIRTLEPQDNLTIHLNTPGGRLDTGIAILSAIAECQGTITMSLDSTAASMGAILFLAGHQYVVHDHSMLMFHTFSGGFYGKSGDVDKQMQAYKRQFSLLMKKVCGKFLTPDEISRIDKGEEMWFMSDAIGKRLKASLKDAPQSGETDQAPPAKRKTKTPPPPPPTEE
jgi:ATP-dependent Clp protease protease subunit